MQALVGHFAVDPRAYCPRCLPVPNGARCNRVGAPLPCDAQPVQRLESEPVDDVDVARCGASRCAARRLA